MFFDMINESLTIAVVLLSIVMLMKPQQKSKKSSPMVASPKLVSSMSSTQSEAREEVSPVIVAPNETRTCVTIKNLPNKITQEFMQAKVEAFTMNFSRIYLPLDQATLHNKGFGFIQFNTTEDAVEFMHAFNGMKFAGEIVNGVRLTTTKAMRVCFSNKQ